ncbi:glutamate 5-kinase [Candidatus Stoquefichus massiliensis]|uniref:glutamate 5-kinase n=1 Tax=Candidatus Stoquefichus massiliensis TaxID=1470350 RepID=UPI0004B4FF0D|nr:glutamate 5-kinase [Candidatus Stoquefichus massiliensis]
MREIKGIKKIIIKVGSSSLCNQNGKIDREKILYLILQISKLIKDGYSIVLVSSGAIAAGMGSLKLPAKPQTIPEKQALAAIGQAQLMQIYEDIFQLFDLKCAQVLLNHGDFDDRKRLMNLSNTMHALMDYGVIPIVNENDALAVDEIKVGDNDTLAALLVPVVDADLLVLVSDIDGLYTSNPHKNSDAKLLKFIDHIDKDIESMAGDSSSGLGTGGMMTKIRAAKIVNDYGRHLVIVNGSKENSLLHIFDETEEGTWFNGHSGKNLNAKLHWIAYRTHSKGQLMIDQGAIRALLQRKSLLPSGILHVDGQFLMGQVIDIIDENHKMIAKGISNYSSDEIKLIMGHNSNDIESILHYKDYDVVVHANNMVIVGGENDGSDFIESVKECKDC